LKSIVLTINFTALEGVTQHFHIYFNMFRIRLGQTDKANDADIVAVAAMPDDLVMFLPAAIRAIMQILAPRMVSASRT
jgi:hypothetical protein